MIRRQVTEIPLVNAEVTEHRLIGRACGCGTVTWGEAPAGVTAPARYGPRAAALGVYLWHGQFLSRDRARSAMADMFGCAPSPGALASMSRKIAGVIAPAPGRGDRDAGSRRGGALRRDGVPGGGEAGLSALRVVGEVRAGHRARQAGPGGNGGGRGAAGLRRDRLPRRVGAL
jgi:hypothetical protein